MLANHVFNTLPVLMLNIFRCPINKCVFQNTKDFSFIIMNPFIFFEYDIYYFQRPAFFYKK